MKTYARVTVPQHITDDPLSLRLPENNTADTSCLLRMDSQFEAIRFAYDRRNRQTVLFVERKTGDYAERRSLSRSGQASWGSFLRGDRFAIRNDRERGWSRYAIRQYFRRENAPVIRQMLPALLRSDEVHEGHRLYDERRQLYEDTRAQMLARQYSKLAETRAKQKINLFRANLMAAVIYHKLSWEQTLYYRLNQTMNKHKAEISAAVNTETSTARANYQSQVPEQEEDDSDE